MAKKTYSPCQVVDPTTENHIAKVYPNQEIHIVISDCKDDCQVFLTSEYLRLDSAEDNSNKQKKIYRFVQTYDLEEWANISSAYLGEITILKKDPETKREFISSVNVMLHGQECHNTNVVTVVNPIGSTIKVEPHQVIELVVFDCLDDDPYLSWEHEIHSGDDCGAIEYELIGREVVYPCVDYRTYLHEDDEKDVVIVMPRMTKEVPSREYHYYFRCTYESLNWIKDSKTTGELDAGRLTFYPNKERNEGDTPAFKYVANLKLNVRQRNRDKIFSTLFFPKNFHIVSTPECIKNAATYKTVHSSKKNTTSTKIVGSNSYSYSGSSYKNKGTSVTTPNRSGSTTSSSYTGYRKSLFLPDVKVAQKTFTAIDSGCTIAWCKKRKKKNRNKR